jgi:hypothetical protein
LALAEFDSDHDGSITSSDERWADLKLWSDTNHDGISQAAELST